ncbi:hypothetical protein Tsubulata_042703 [Turnera subulata]|uniref:FMN hydroxy acid dehydrogenase domain-containing protein n=1 Tax=Turnera subulata TaxID=218843 RepID=A0A9Q0GKP3_9ROSI|nr:hypothetical protein Tsubulata_042703 [Turnera subulata]
MYRNRAATAKLVHRAERHGYEAIVLPVDVPKLGRREADIKNKKRGTIDVLEEVVHAVGGKIPVLFDGGIRRVTDIFKALALGAQAVLIGRPVVFGLAAKGEYGVKRVLQMLKDKLELTMALSGCPSLKDISRGHVKTAQDRIQSML